MSPLRVTFSSKSEHTIQNPPPSRRPDTGTRGGAVPRKVCGEGAPLSSLSSGQFSSGEGARQARLSAPFPAPSWVALSPTPPPIHLQGAPRGADRLSNASLNSRGPGPSCYTLPPRLLPNAGFFPTCSCRNSGCRRGLLPRGRSSLRLRAGRPASQGIRGSKSGEGARGSRVGGSIDGERPGHEGA